MLKRTWSSPLGGDWQYATALRGRTAASLPKRCKGMPASKSDNSIRTIISVTVTETSSAEHEKEHGRLPRSEGRIRLAEPRSRWQLHDDSAGVNGLWSRSSSIWHAPSPIPVSPPTPPTVPATRTPTIFATSSPGSAPNSLTPSATTDLFFPEDARHHSLDLSMYDPDERRRIYALQAAFLRAHALIMSVPPEDPSYAEQPCPDQQPTRRW